MEKEVVLLDPIPVASTAATPVLDQIQIDASGSGASSAGSSSSTKTGTVNELAPRVLKVIKKIEAQILCTQHNPVRVVCCYVAILTLTDKYGRLSQQ